MKPISELSLKECILVLKYGLPIDDANGGTVRATLSPVMQIDVANRIHDLTRWVPVSERMPTEADGDMDGRVLVFERGKYTPHKTYTRFAKWDSVDDVDYFYTVTHWQRITPPEDK